MDNNIDVMIDRIILAWTNAKMQTCWLVPLNMGKWLALKIEFTSKNYPLFQIRISQADVTFLENANTPQKTTWLRNRIGDNITAIINQYSSNIHITNFDNLKTPSIEMTIDNHLAYFWLEFFFAQGKIHPCQNPGCPEREIVFGDKAYCSKQCGDSARQKSGKGLLNGLLNKWAYRYSGIPTSEWQNIGEEILAEGKPYKSEKPGEIDVYSHLNKLKKHWIAEQNKERE